MKQEIDIQPNKASWILGDGRVVDVAVEGLNQDGSAFSHGMFVKKWIRFRTQNFFPGKEEVELAKAMERRAKLLLAENPDLKSDEEERCEEDRPNPFEGDLAYVQAAEEQGWIRVKPLPNPVLDNAVFFETFSPDLKPEVAEVVDAVRALDLKMTLLTGGAIVNRGFWVQRSIE